MPTEYDKYKQLCESIVEKIIIKEDNDTYHNHDKLCEIQKRIYYDNYDAETLDKYLAEVISIFNQIKNLSADQSGLVNEHMRNIKNAKGSIDRVYFENNVEEIKTLRQNCVRFIDGLIHFSASLL